MQASTLKNVLTSSLKKQSGLEPRRPYLGMSGISQCPRKLYFDFVDGREAANDQQHWYCWTGYLHEGAVVALLADLGAERKQTEVIAAFDSRFRGHIDYLFSAQEIIEIKSVTWDKFCKVQAEDRAEYGHEAQVQMYLRHGGWQRAKIIYIARDVPHREFRGMPLWVIDTEPKPGLADKLDAKAKAVLAAIDSKTAPACECGWCKR